MVNIKTLQIIFTIAMMNVYLSGFSNDNTTRLYGKIVDSRTGEYLSGVSVGFSFISGEKISSITTDKSGTYQFDIPTGGEYVLKVSKNEYTDTGIITDTVKIMKGEQKRRDFSLEKPVRFIHITEVSNNDKDIEILNVGTLASIGTEYVEFYNAGTVPLKYVVGKNCDWIIAVSPLSGTLDPMRAEQVSITIDPAKLEAGKTTGKVLVMTNNGNAALSIKAVGNFPEITVLPAVTTAYRDDKNLFPDTFQSEIKFGGKHTFKEMGFCFSDKNQIPTTTNDKCVLANDIGNFSYKDYWNDTHLFPWLEGGLESWETDACKTYYVRAFLKYENENDTTIYSNNVIRFTLWEILCP